MLGGHLAVSPGTDAREEPLTSSRGRRPVHHRRSALRASVAAPDLSNVRGLWYRDDGRPVEHRPHPSSRTWMSSSPARVGPAPMTAIGRTTGTASATSSANPMRRSTRARLPLPLHVLLHPRAVQERQTDDGAGEPGVNSYRFWTPGRVVEEIDLLVKDTVSETSRSPTRCSS